MAFPAVVATATGATAATNTTSHAITLPSGVTAGEMLLVAFSCDGIPTISVNTGVSGTDWTLGQSPQGSTVTAAYAWKIAAGGDALTLTTSASEQSSHISYRISGAASVSGTAFGDSTVNSNPPSHTPAGGVADYLWIVTRSGDDIEVASAAPASYSNLLTQAAAGTGGASTNAAERQLNASSEDPGAFTSPNEQWRCWTLAVAPAAGAYTLTASAGSFALAGSATALLSQRKVVAGAGSHALTGSAAGLLAGRVVAASVGVLTLTGSAADLVKASAASFTLTADAGSFALTGSAAALLRGMRVAADAGAYALTGAPASLLAGKRLPGDAGSFAMAGAAAGLLTSRSMAADVGAFALTGSDASLVKTGSYALAADAGAYALTGGAASLARTWIMHADAASFALEGAAAALLAGRALAADAGGFAFQGGDAGLVRLWVLLAEAGDWAVSGADAGLTYSGPISAPVVTPASRRIAAAAETRAAAAAASPLRLAWALSETRTA